MCVSLSLRPTVVGEVTEGCFGVANYTFTVIDNKFFLLLIFFTFNNLVSSFRFVFNLFSFFSSEGGVIFIDNNNNKFHIKTFRLDLCLFLFLLKLLLQDCSVLHACIETFDFFLCFCF